MAKAMGEWECENDSKAPAGAAESLSVIDYFCRPCRGLSLALLLPSHGSRHGPQSAGPDGPDRASQIYALTGTPPFRRQHSLRDQIERAAVSVSNNVAEGFERGTTQELLTFLYIARGSAGEVWSMLCLLETFPAFDNLKSEIEIPRRRSLPATACLGRLPAELADYRATVS
jgi:four helix bundle protein